MGIEHDIKQSKFRSEHQKAGINLMYTASFISNNNQHLLKGYGLTLPQFNILRILRGQYPKATTVNDLIDRMIDKSSNASRIVEKLRAKKLVERKVCEGVSGSSGRTGERENGGAGEWEQFSEIFPISENWEE